MTEQLILCCTQFFLVLTTRSIILPNIQQVLLLAVRCPLTKGIYSYTKGAKINTADSGMCSSVFSVVYEINNHIIVITRDWDVPETKE